MNQKEWKKSGKFPGKYIWYNKTRKIQKSLQYNSDEKADRIHHLRDTEEQRKYNDEHYELWGHNLDGSFEYGKYVVFVTEEWHNSYHTQSEETRQKIIEERKKYWNDERRQQVSYRMKKLFKDNPELHPDKGKHHSDATKQKMSESAKNRAPISDESKKKISESIKNKIGIIKEKYIEYKSNGGTMTWNEFQKWVKQCG